MRRAVPGDGGAVWAAYGWAGEDPAAVDEDAVLAWLLALNLGRASIGSHAPVGAP